MRKTLGRRQSVCYNYAVLLQAERTFSSSEFSVDGKTWVVCCSTPGYTARTFSNSWSSIEGHLISAYAVARCEAV